MLSSNGGKSANDSQPASLLLTARAVIVADAKPNRTMFGLFVRDFQFSSLLGFTFHQRSGRGKHDLRESERVA